MTDQRVRIQVDQSEIGKVAFPPVSVLSGQPATTTVERSTDLDLNGREAAKLAAKATVSGLVLMGHAAVISGSRATFRLPVTDAEKTVMDRYKKLQNRAVLGLVVGGLAIASGVSQLGKGSAAVGVLATILGAIAFAVGAVLAIRNGRDTLVLKRSKRVIHFLAHPDFAAAYQSAHSTESV